MEPSHILRTGMHSDETNEKYSPSGQTPVMATSEYDLVVLPVVNVQLSRLTTSKLIRAVLTIDVIVTDQFLFAYTDEIISTGAVQFISAIITVLNKIAATRLVDALKIPNCIYEFDLNLLDKIKKTYREQVNSRKEHLNGAGA